MLAYCAAYINKSGLPYYDIKAGNIILITILQTC